MKQRRWPWLVVVVALLAAGAVYGVQATTVASAATPTLFGATVRRMGAETYTQALQNRETEYGTFGVVRVFFGGNPGSWTSETLRPVRPVNVSFKADADAVNAGSLDSTYRAWFAAAPTDRPIWWTYYHEPEDNIAGGEFTAAAYRAAWQRIWRISREPGVAKVNVRSALVLMDYTTDVRSGRNWRDYYPGAGYVDVMSWDIYQFNEEDASTTNDESMAQHQQRRPTLAISRGEGKPFAISEMGYDAPATRPAWLRQTADWARANNAAFVAYFDTVGTLGDHRLLDAASQAVWRGATTGTQWTGPPVSTVTAGPAAATSSTIQWTGHVDPRDQTWYVSCASWVDGVDGLFVETPAGARIPISGNPESIVCGRTGLPGAAAVTVRIKLYDAGGSLRYRSDTLVIGTTP